MKILVTGCSGFIGAKIASAYSTQGYEVIGLDRLPPPRDLGLSQFIQADLAALTANQKQKILDLARNVKIVNHHAAQIDVRRSIQDPAYDASQNILSSLFVLELTRTCGAHLIFASSAGAINGSEFPSSPYGISKLTIEKYIHFYANQHSLSYTILRYPNIYGPGQQSGVVGIFCRKLLGNETISITGGEQTRDFVFVDDIVKINLLATRYPQKVITVASEQNISIQELANMIKKLVPSSTSALHIENYVIGEVMKSEILMSTELNDFSFTPLSIGVQKTLEYWYNINKGKDRDGME